jgi:hypothetical protein
MSSASRGRTVGDIEQLLVELGHPALDDLDDERETLADTHDDGCVEVAAFARRGWAYVFDAEVGAGYDPQVYEDLLAEILRPLGVESVSFDSHMCIVEIDGRAIHVQRPEHDSEWLDVRWIFDMTSLVLAGHDWQLVCVGDDDPHRVIVGVVPTHVWATIHAQEQAGAWEAVEPFDPTTSSAYRAPLALPRRPMARRLMN